MVFFVGELYLALVTSTQAHAKLLKVDPTKALSMTGVVDFISHKDVPGHNTWGVIPEESFASTEVTIGISYTNPVKITLYLLYQSVSIYLKKNDRFHKNKIYKFQ